MNGSVMIMAGGTGGHVFPALAVANELRRRAIDVTWLGTRRGLEARVVPEANIDIDWIDVSGVRGKGLSAKVLSGLRLIRAVFQALRIVARRRPSVVLGMGGFAAGPGGLAAWLLRRPLVIHEQNSVAGLTNRALSRFAKRVLCAFPGSFKSGRQTTVVGNPVRADIVASADNAAREIHSPPRLLVLGGSQGAQALNRLVPGALAALAPANRPQVWHQTGAKTVDAAREKYRQASIDVRLETFIEDMSEAYQWADLVLCRAGALTVAEIAMVGVASILVPFPYAVDDHQTGNALFLKDAGAAFLVAEKELNETRLAEMISDTLARPDVLQDMARRARALAKPNAVQDVVDVLVGLAAGGRA